MTDGPSFNCAKSGIFPNCVTAFSFSSPVFNEVPLGTRLHDSRSGPGRKEYGAVHATAMSVKWHERRHSGLRP